MQKEIDKNYQIWKTSIFVIGWTSNRPLPKQLIQSSGAFLSGSSEQTIRLLFPHSINVFLFCLILETNQVRHYRFKDKVVSLPGASFWKSQPPGAEVHPLVSESFHRWSMIFGVDYEVEDQSVARRTQALVLCLQCQLLVLVPCLPFPPLALRLPFPPLALGLPHQLPALGLWLRLHDQEESTEQGQVQAGQAVPLLLQSAIRLWNHLRTSHPCQPKMKVNHSEKT